MSNLVELLLNTPKSPNNHLVERLDLIEGYSEAGIQEIERRYNLSIHGQFKEFLMTMGKNSGGLLLGKSIRIFNSYLKPTSDCFGQHLQELWQNIEDNSEFLYLINYLDLVKKQFFLFGDDDQTYFYFMFTANKDNLIYVYYDGEGENKSESLKVLGTLFDFLKSSRKYTACNIVGDNDLDFLRLTTGRLL